MKPLFLFFSENLDFALGWMVIHSLWQATLIAFVLGILQIVLRKKAAKLRYVIANVALLAVVVSAIVTFCMYYDFAKEPAKISFTPINEEGIFQTINVPQTDVQNPTSDIVTPLSIQGFKAYFNQNIALIVTFWLLGVAIFLLKLMGGISYIYYLKNRMNFPADEYWTEMLARLSEKAGLKQGVEIVESALVRTPMVIGHLKPLILFPMGVINRLAPEEVEAILAHELAHVMRKDFIFNVLQSVVEALFYFHPAVWWMSSQVRNERESACDDFAISLIDSKMNYARALVAIQEMAYFPLTPSLAFAGQRKSQLVVRMQRILNQPNNKTNVMEKIIATGALVLVMAGLAFGENSVFNSNSTPSVSEAKMTDLTTNLTDLNGFYLNLPNNSDSLPVSNEIPNGIYSFEDNTQTAQLTVKNNFVTALKVNGIDLTDAQLPNYKKLINKIIRAKQPENAVNTEGSAVSELIKNPGENITLDNLAQNIDIGKMGGADLDMSESGDGSMIVKGKDGSRTLIENGKDGMQVVTSTDKYGNVSKVMTDKNGKVFTENYDKTGKLTGKSTITNTTRTDNTVSTTIQNDMNGDVSRTEINGDAVATIQKDGSKSVIDKDSEGHTHFKKFDAKGTMIEDIKVVGDKFYLNGRELNAEEMRARYLMPNGKDAYDSHRFTDRNGNSYDRFGRKDAATSKDKNGFSYTYSNSHTDDGDEGDAEHVNLDNRTKLKVKLNDLKAEIEECGCEANNFTQMRSRLTQKIKVLLIKIDRNYDIIKAQNEYQIINDEWESKDDAKDSSGFNNAKNSGKDSRGEAKKVIEKAMKDSKQAERSSEQLQVLKFLNDCLVRDQEQAKRDAETARKDNEQTKREIEQTRRDALTVREDMKRAKRDIEQAKRDLEQTRRDDEQKVRDRDAQKRDELHEALLKELKRDGYIRDVENFNMNWNNKGMMVDGKSVSAEKLAKYVKIYERVMGSKPTKSWNMSWSSNN